MLTDYLLILADMLNDKFQFVGIMVYEAITLSGCLYFWGQFAPERERMKEITISSEEMIDLLETINYMSQPPDLEFSDIAEEVEIRVQRPE